MLRSAKLVGLILAATACWYTTANTWAQTTWQGTTTNWGTAGNWSSGIPGATTETIFRNTGGGIVDSVDVTGAARTAGKLTFNANAGTFQITGLTTANTLTLDGPNSTTAVDLSVASGNPKIVGSGGLTEPFGSTSTGDIILTGLSGTEWYVVDIASGASLDLQASLTSVSNSTSRRSHFVVQGGGRLIFGKITNIDLRPQASGVQGGLFIDNGILQLSGPGARGNNFMPITVAPVGGGSQSMLEFKNTGNFVFNNSTTDNTANGANGNRSIVTISGTGVGGLGAIYNSQGNTLLPSGGNSSAAAGGGLGLSVGLFVIAPGGASIGVADDTTLTLSHGISQYGSYSNETGGAGTAGKLTKVGTGTLVFDANNNSARNGYASEIIVNAGTFLVNSPTVGKTFTASSVGQDPGPPTVGNVTNVVPANVADLNGLYIGMPVTGTGIAANTVVAGIGTDGLRLSEDATFGTNIELTFHAVTDALNGSPVTVNTGGTFGGTGLVPGSTVTVNGGGILAPGASIGTLTVGNAVIDGTLQIEYSGSSIDKLVVAGPGGASPEADFNEDGFVDAADYVVWRKGIDVPSTLENYELWRSQFGDTGSAALDITNASLVLTNLGGGLSNATHVIAEYTSLNGAFGGGISGMPAGFEIDYDLGGNKIALVPIGGGATSTLDNVAVPEPSAIVLLGLGVVLLTYRRKALPR